MLGTSSKQVYCLFCKLYLVSVAFQKDALNLFVFFMLHQETIMYELIRKIHVLSKNK